jgi:serine/threonine protein kinase
VPRQAVVDTFSKLLQKNPLLRITDSRIKRHPYFQMIDWTFSQSSDVHPLCLTLRLFTAVRNRRYIPPFVPDLNPDDELDTSNFDQAFLSMTPAVFDPEEDLQPEEPEDEEDSKAPKVPQSPLDEHGNDVFSGYSFKGDSDTEDDSLPSFDETDEHNLLTHVHDDSAHGASEGFGSPNVAQEDHTGQQSIDVELDVSVPEVPDKDSVVDRPPLAERISEEDEDWERIENDGDEAKNGRKRRGLTSGTLFARGITDKCESLACPIVPSNPLK